MSRVQELQLCILFEIKRCLAAEREVFTQDQSSKEEIGFKKKWMKRSASGDSDCGTWFMGEVEVTEGKQVWKSYFSFLISACVFSYLKPLESNRSRRSFPTRQHVGVPAKAGRASDGTVPLCVLPSALLAERSAQQVSRSTPRRPLQAEPKTTL